MSTIRSTSGDSELPQSTIFSFPFIQGRLLKGLSQTPATQFSAPNSWKRAQWDEVNTTARRKGTLTTLTPSPQGDCFTRESPLAPLATRA